MGIIAALGIIVTILAVVVGWLAGGRAALLQWRGRRPIELGPPQLLLAVAPDTSGLASDERERGRYATVHALNHSDHPHQVALEGSRSTLHSPSGRVCDRVLELGPRSGRNFHITVVVSDSNWTGSEVDIQLVGHTDGKAKVRWRGTAPVEAYYSVVWAAWD